LERVEDAFARRREEAALEGLLDAWRETQARELVALIEKLTARLSEGLSPLMMAAASQYRFRPHPMDVPRLLAGFVEEARVLSPEYLARHLGTLQQWPRDPRVLPALLAVARLPVASRESVAKGLCDAVAGIGVLYDATPLRSLREKLLPSQPLLAERLEEVIHLGLSRVPPALAPEVQARCAALGAAIDSRIVDERRGAALREELLARVREAPEDDEARRVLADQLLMLEDPLGELISLQCAERPDEVRLSELLAAHQVRWEAPLGFLVARGGTRFERGFPVAVQMQGNPSRLPLPEPGPSWKTVEEIDWSAGFLWDDWEEPLYQDWGQWLSHPHLRRVTSLRRVSSQLVRALEGWSLPVRHLELTGGVHTERAEVLRALSTLPSLSSLRLESGEPADLELFARSPLAPRLERFEMTHFTEGSYGFIRSSARPDWTLSVSPRARGPVELVLTPRLRTEPLVAAIRAATGFGCPELRLAGASTLSARANERLREAVTGYERVRWE